MAKSHLPKFGLKPRLNRDNEFNEFFSLTETFIPDLVIYFNNQFEMNN